MPVIFKNAGELADPVKINKALNTEFDSLREETQSGLSDATGKFNKHTSVINSLSNVPESLQNGHFIVELNDTNKRIVLKEGGKVFYADLNELT
jgi:hypothetical protein